jgi:lipooligosaccharide transport system ATP-binding protein
VTEYPAPAGGGPAVEVRNLVKAYNGRAVVDGLTFSVQPGEVFALLGPNGAGKTTTVEILEGYRKPDSGTARVLNLDPARQGAELKPRIGLMLQQGGLFPQITAREALRLFAAFYPDAEDPDKLIALLELREVADTRFRQLSGGQKQRLSLGLALIGRPRLVFLDEPTAAMDPQARRSTWNIIRALRESGTTVLLTTHFMDEAERLCDRLIVLDHGRKIAEGTPRALIAEHLESDVVEVYGDGAAAAGLRHAALAERIETSGETVFFYLREPKRLLDAFADDHSIRYLHRPANLEDLFLKLTGRQIRDDA